MPFDTLGDRPGLRPLRDPFGRVPPIAEPEPQITGLRNPFRIRRSVGMDGRNERRVVAKVESLLGRAGELNLKETGGVTGFVGLRMDEAIRRFQNRHGLNVDGRVTPGGETITKLAALLAAKQEPDAVPDHGSDQRPDQKGPVLPETPFKTRDRLDSMPTVPDTLD